MNRGEILVAFSGDGLAALGNIWRITAKKIDFYLDPLGQEGSFHLSVHGPSDRHPDGHRFHVKVDRKATATVEQRGDFIVHSIPRKGHAFDGQGLAPAPFASREFVGCGTCNGPASSRLLPSPALCPISRTTSPA